MDYKFTKSICFLIALFHFSISASNAQNPKIRCYFNHPVNNSYSTGTNATYLKGTFPDTIVSYINKAKYTLDFAVYNFTSVANDSVSKIATAVNNAYKRGVKIRWINDGSSSNSGMKLLNTSIPRISSPTGGSYTIMHNKFVVVDINSPNTDDVFLITGSYNYSVQQTITDYNNLVVIQDQKVATAYYDQFNQMWGGTDTLPNTTLSAFGTHKVTSKNHYFNVNGTPVDVRFSPKDSCGVYLAKVANSASNDLTYGIYTFTDNTIANIILNKYNSKLIVRGIEDNFSKTYTPYSTLSTPLGNNFVIYTGSGLYHSKVMVADALMPSSDPQVATGSFNWTAAAENSNDENLIVIHDPIIANQYYQALCNDIAVNGGNSCVLPLPVKWLSLTASFESDKTTINWEIADKLNANSFEVERSQDGIRFEKMGVVEVTTNNKYQFVDISAHEGYNYYRLKQVDDNGIFTYSNVVNVYNRSKNSLVAYPNPVFNQLKVFLPLNANYLTVYSSVGIKLMEFDVRSRSSLKIDVSHLAKGGYYIQVQSNDLKTIKEFNKL